MDRIKKGKFVYRNEDGMKKMHAFYDKTLAALCVPYEEENFDTSFGKTHCLLVGDTEKPRICTIHGGNGITTLNLKLFLPLLEEFYIIAPDVIGMPGKSAPYRNISSKKDEYGLSRKCLIITRRKRFRLLYLHIVHQCFFHSRKDGRRELRVPCCLSLQGLPTGRFFP